MEKSLEWIRGKVCKERTYINTYERILDWIQRERWRWRKGRDLRNTDEGNSQDWVVN